MVTRNVQNWTGVEGEKGPQHIPTTFVVLLCYPVLCNLIDGTHREEVMGALFSRERRPIFLSSEIIEALWLQLSTLHKCLCSFVSHPLHCCWHPLLCSLEYLNKSCVAVPLRDSTLQQSKQFTVSSASWRGYKKLFCFFLSSPGDSAWTKTYNLIIIKLFFFLLPDKHLPASVGCKELPKYHYLTLYFLLYTSCNTFSVTGARTECHPSNFCPLCRLGSEGSREAQVSLSSVTACSFSGRTPD